MRHATLTIALMLGAVLAAGCGAERESASSRLEAPASIMVNGEYSDKRFIDTMAPHHQMAIEMAKEALERSTDKDIRAMSEKIVRSQSNEIEELKRLRNKSFGSRDTPAEMHPDVIYGMGMGEHRTSGPGAHQKASSDASSDEFDRRFLDDMLAHHAAAIQHASLTLIHSDNKRLKIIAREIVDEQAREIGMMGQWRLARWEHVL